MRKQFSELLYNEMAANEDIILLTGDLGYGLWDKIRMDFPDRFYNVGSAEQLMIGLAVGMSMEYKIPVVYSITPFLLFRPFELLRNYLNHEGHIVKLVGGGRDKDYGNLGFSHWATDDMKILSTLHKIKLYKPEPFAIEDSFRVFINDPSPGYINLSK